MLNAQNGILCEHWTESELIIIYNIDILCCTSAGTSCVWKQWCSGTICSHAPASAYGSCKVYDAHIDYLLAACIFKFINSRRMGWNVPKILMRWKRVWIHRHTHTHQSEIAKNFKFRTDFPFEIIYQHNGLFTIGNNLIECSLLFLIYSHLTIK